MGPLKEQLYSYLSEDIQVRLLQHRLQAPDCNAGVIIDGLISPVAPNQTVTLKLLMAALGPQALQMIILNHHP